MVWAIAVTPASGPARVIDSAAPAVNAGGMDPDELFAKGPGDPLTMLTRQDLDPLSVAELETRIAALSGEIARRRYPSRKR